MDSKKAAAASAADLAAVAVASAAINAASLNSNASEFSPAASVSSLSVKLPDFWLTDPEMWFTQAESVFRRAGIKSSLTKYDYAMQKLPCEVLQSVRELARRVRTGAVDDPYEELEEKLTASYQKSPWQCTFELLDMPDLGNRRPSVMMDNMLALLPEDVPPNRLFLALFLRRLPADIRDHLVTQDLKTPAEMAAAANRLFDARPQGASVAAVSASDRRGRRDFSPSSQNRRRSPSRNRRRPIPARSSDNNGLCFYHDSFGKRAVKCQPPCSWAGNRPAADGFAN
jgi:hypothetical protein